MSRDNEGERSVDPPPNASRDRDAAPRTLSRAEWLKALGPGFTDRTDEAVEKGLAFIITDGSAPSRLKPKGGER